MMLRELRVENLFGEFTHVIPFKIEDGLTLLHGPNGVGKTTVLRALDGLFNRKFRFLRTLPLAALHVDFDNGDHLQVTKKEPVERRSAPLEFILSPIKGRAHTWEYKSSANIDFPLSAIDEYVPDLARISPHEWVVGSTGLILDLDGVLDRYQDRLPFPGRWKHEEIPAWLTETLDRVPVYLIKADRLSSPYDFSPRRSSRRPVRDRVPTVSVYSDDLAEKIKRTLASYADFSQTLDSTFPTRLLEEDTPSQKTPTDDEIKDGYAEQAKRRNRYVKVGLLDAGDVLQLPDRPLNAMERRVLATYLRDVDRKLDQLDNLADKLELFLSIVNGKFRRKSIRVDRDRESGLCASTSEGLSLELSSLSSGEQQEIVLAYGLLFQEEPGTMILLDEPELSLHASWQLDLIPDLLKIAELAKLEFLIATHSPQIINDRWDLTVALSDELPE